MPPRRSEWREVEPGPDDLGDIPPPDEPGRGSVLGDYASRLLPGGVILDDPAVPPAVWGSDDIILWAEGESLIIAGPDGTGKTTVAGQLIRGRLGIGDGIVLGHAVEPGKLNVLYLMMDRPRQARRALRRMFTTADRGVLDDKLVIWQGPPPADLARYPSILAELARAAGADTVVIDSLKDAALKLSDDETGSGWNRARQILIESGAELIELHHPRKAQSDNRKPAKLEDLYGSRWITAGAGSVISLWGEAGDLVVEFTHLKPPAAQAGPWKIAIDPLAGTVAIDGPAYDLVDLVRWTGAKGLTADVAAATLFAVERPTEQQIKKAVYRLNKKTADGVLYRRAGSRGGGKEREPTRWFLAASNPKDLGGEQSENQSENPESVGLSGAAGAGSWAAEQSEKQSEPIRNDLAAKQSENRGDVSPRFRDCYDQEPGQ